jgi:hypothetical protein
MKAAKASVIASTNDPVSHDPEIRLGDELSLSFRLPTRSIRLETYRFGERVSCLVHPDGGPNSLGVPGVPFHGPPEPSRNIRRDVLVPF